MATRSANKKGPTSCAAMCVLTIGHVEVLLPAEAGVKVVNLLRGAVRGYSGFDGRARDFEIHEELEVEYCAIKPGQVRMRREPATDQPRTLAIGREPQKLTHG